MSEKIKTLSFDLWTSSLKASFLSLKTLWWRYGVIAFITLCLVFLTLIMAYGVISLDIFSLGDLFTNIQLGGAIDMPSLWFYLALLLLVLILGGVFICISFISNFLLVKNYREGGDLNPLKLFFIKSRTYFWRYNGVIFLLFWKMFWRALLWLLLFLIMLVGFNLGVVLFASSLVASIVEIAILVLFYTGLFSIMFWVITKFLFSVTYLIKTNASVGESLSKSDEIVKGNFWGVLGFWGLFTILMTVMIMLFESPQTLIDLEVIADENWIYQVSGLISFLFQVLILTPVKNHFTYDLMERVAQYKKIKL